MNFDKSRYPLLLSKEDKATYIALAEHFQKSQASLMFKLYEMYHSVLEQGGERLLRIRSSNTFGDEFSLDRKETVMLMFLSSDKSTLDEAARKTGKTLKNYMIDLVKCGLYFNGFTGSNYRAEEPVINEPPPDPPVKRKRGRPKGSTSAKSGHPVQEKKPDPPVITFSAKPPADPLPSPSVQVIPESERLPRRIEEQQTDSDDLSNDDIFNMLNNGDISVL